MVSSIVQCQLSMITIYYPHRPLVCIDWAREQEENHGQPGEDHAGLAVNAEGECRSCC